MLILEMVDASLSNTSFYDIFLLTHHMVYAILFSRNYKLLYMRYPLMKTLKQIPKLLLCLTCSLFLCSCGSKHLTTSIPAAATDKVVVGVDELSLNFCITDQGMLYPMYNTIRYYDFETDNVYVLCDKANCRHSDESCGAWYDNPTSIRGLALYGDFCYRFQKNTEKNTWDFIRMDLTGGNIKTLASLDIGDYSPDGRWILSAISQAFYCGNTVWYSADYSYSEEKDGKSWHANSRVYGGISLTDGSIITLNEPLNDGTVFQLQAVTMDKLLFMKRSPALPRLTPAGFSEELEKGTFGTDFDHISKSDETDYGTFYDSYYEYYYFNWWPHHCEMTEEYILCSADTGEMSVLETFPALYDENEQGEIWDYHSRYFFVGEYDGKLLVDWTKWEEGEKSLEECRLYLWDLEQNTKTAVCSFRGGIGFYGGDDGEYNTHIYDNSKFLYCLYGEKDGDPMDFFEYDLETGESSEKLYELVYGGDFHVLGKTSDMFIVRKPYELLDTYGYEAYKISKDDYYAGRLDKAIKLKL